MEVWESLEFGARAMALRSVAKKSPEEIQDIQRSRLEDLVEHAREKSSYYREKYAKINSSSFELTDLPTTTKSQVMENFNDALTVANVRREEVEAFLADESNLGKYFHEEYVLSHTSGSQGQPLLIVQSKENLDLLFALHISRGNHESLNLWEAVKHLITPARLAAVILKRGFYPSACAFEYMSEGARQFLEVLPVCLTDDDLLQQIEKFRPTHLTAYASVLHELARETEAGRITLKPALEQVVNISERLMPQARDHYAQVFDAPILDDYAMGECLFLTNGCVATGGMHVNADWAILEVVDENNRPVPDGEKGAKVLITNLANHVQPIIRYEIGDLVTMATKPCGCGSNLPLVGRVDGRDSDMFYIDDEKGQRPLSPTVFELALGQVLDAREYQIIQEESHRFRIKLEPLPGATLDRDKAAKMIEKHLSEHGLDGELQVELEVVERLAPENGDKFKRVVSNVKPAKDANRAQHSQSKKTAAR